MKFILFPLLISYHFIQAQYLHPAVPYEKIHYEGLNPDWYETTYDPTAVTDSFDGYNHLRWTYNVPELRYENLMITPQYSYKVGLNGSFIECRSIDDGSLLWQQKFTIDSVDHVELIAHMYVNTDRQLVVYSHKERKPYVKYEFQFFFKDMILTKRVYDLNTGALVSYFHRDYDDTDAFKTVTSFHTIGGSLLFNENKLLRYIEKISIGNSVYMKSCLLDETGARVSKIDSILVENFTILNYTVVLHKDTILDIQSNRNTHQLIFRYLSPDLKLYHEVVTDSLPYDITYITYKQLSSDGSKFLFHNYNETDDGYQQEVMVFDKKGKIIKYKFLPSYAAAFHVLEWEDIDRDIIIMDKLNAVVNDTAMSLLRVLKLREGQDKEVIKYFKADNFLRWAGPLSSHKLPNNKYYLRMFESAFKSGTVIYFPDEHASAYSQMVVDIANLGLTTSTSDEVLGSARANIFPNPVQELCNITFDELFSGTITIHNTNGQMLQSLLVKSSNVIQFPTSNYSAGLYFIVCRDMKGVKKDITLKFIKLN